MINSNTNRYIKFKTHRKFKEESKHDLKDKMSNYKEKEKSMH